MRRHDPGARIEGVLVQEMVRDAVEVILGIVNNPQFGPAIMFGLGGIFTEVLKDVSFRFAPVSPGAALEMIREIKGYRILEGVRGRERVDVDALAATITTLSAIAIDLKDEVAALDVNPLFVFPRSGGTKAGDALIVRSSG
ncbi:MAG: acetate--CoA ligase family protein [Betaproteobacteria bacterium]|nr:acetate--CoA ligase family protein [Betaproteobacteria bacterium]